jgi:hypothetical protein
LVDRLNSHARYVVLHHTGYGTEHFDFMLDLDAAGPLLTWRLPAWPAADVRDATPLPPHRRVYLEYEGPIGGDRGFVRRVAAGTCDVRRFDGQIVVTTGDCRLELADNLPPAD